MTVFKGYGPGTNHQDQDPHYVWGVPKKVIPAYHAKELDKMPLDQFQDLARRVEAEVARRVKPIVQDFHDAFNNFMLGVTQAMACRFVLRWLNGHNPVGTRAASGEMWHALDGSEVATRFFHGMGPKIKPSYKVVRALHNNPMSMSAEHFTTWLKASNGYTDFGGKHSHFDITKDTPHPLLSTKQFP